MKRLATPPAPSGAHADTPLVRVLRDPQQEEQTRPCLGV